MPRDLIAGRKGQGGRGEGCGGWESDTHVAKAADC